MSGGSSGVTGIVDVGDGAERLSLSRRRRSSGVPPSQRCRRRYYPNKSAEDGRFEMIEDVMSGYRFKLYIPILVLALRRVPTR
jgi:hypothetical protein